MDMHGDQFMLGLNYKGPGNEYNANIGTITMNRPLINIPRNTQREENLGLCNFQKYES